MSIVATKQVSDIDYQRLLAIQIANKNPYSEHFRGSRKTLIVFDREICTSLSGGDVLDIGEISDRQFKSFLGSFKRGLYCQLQKNPELINLQVDFTGMSKGKNKKEFQKIRNYSYYWNIDLSSAYWQIGHKLGYVSDNFYSKYINRNEYKAVKRLCFSFLSRTNWREYNLLDQTFIINCDNTLERQCYKNVRKELYRIISGALEIAGDEYIDFNIDAISVCKSKKNEILDYFKELNLDVKVNRITKINDFQIDTKGRIRNF